MAELQLAIWSLALAWLLMRWLPGPDKWAMRIGAVLALVGVSIIVDATVVGSWMDSLGGWLASTTGDVVSEADASLGSALAVVMVPIGAFVAAAYWVWAMLPHKARKVGGEAVTLEYRPGQVWVSSLILAPFMAVIPGKAGEVARAILEKAIEIGELVIQAVFG